MFGSVGLWFWVVWIGPFSKIFTLSIVWSPQTFIQLYYRSDQLQHDESCDLHLHSVLHSWIDTCCGPWLVNMVTDLPTWYSPGLAWSIKRECDISSEITLYIANFNYCLFRMKVISITQFFIHSHQMCYQGKWDVADSGRRGITRNPRNPRFWSDIEFLEQDGHTLKMHRMHCTILNFSNPGEDYPTKGLKDLCALNPRNPGC